MLFAFPEKPLGLYDPSFDENSRGVGFVAKLSGERSSLLLRDFSTLDIKDDEKPKRGKKKSGAVEERHRTLGIIFLLRLLHRNLHRCVVQMAHFSVLFFGMDQHHREAGSHSSKSQFQKFLHRPRSFRGITPPCPTPRSSSPSPKDDTRRDVELPLDSFPNFPVQVAVTLEKMNTESKAKAEIRFFSYY
ncbi:hypothetical protein ACFX2J_035377 [Malus domestica]